MARGALGGWRRRRILCGCALAAALLAAAGLRSRPAAPRTRRQLFPRHSPDALAHFLADFSNYLHLYPDISSWAVEDEWSNYTSWRYEVAYECGARCAGRLALRHDAGGEGGAGGEAGGEGRAGGRHRVSVRDERCARVSLLPLHVCEETETETLITGSAEGAVVRETTRGRRAASPLAALARDALALNTA